MNQTPVEQSPATVYAYKAWIQDFRKEVEARRYKVNFVSVHRYGGPNVKDLINYLKQIHQTYDRPIWITKFTIANWKVTS